MGSLVLLTAGGLYPNQPCHALLPILQWALAWIDIENDDDDIMTMAMMTMMTMMIRRTMTEGDDCGSSQRVWPDKWSRWSISRLQSPNIGTSELIRWLKWVGGWWRWWWVMVWNLTQKLVYVCFWQISNIDRIYIYRSLAHGSDACQKLWAWTVDTFNFVANIGLVLTYAFFKGLL